MSIESTRETMLRYFNSEHGDISMIAEDVVFTIMATGQEHHGPDAVLGMLNYFYRCACCMTWQTTKSSAAASILKCLPSSNNLECQWVKQIWGR